MDEQRLQARIAALRLAFPAFPEPQEIEIRFGMAEEFEEWLMRDRVPGVTDVNVSDKPTPPAAFQTRQPCGAFLRPDWFAGGQWLSCTGQHSKNDVHISSDGMVFYTHHLTDNAAGKRCACGGPWPCEEKPPATAPTASPRVCGFVWRGEGESHEHHCARTPEHTSLHGCEICGTVYLEQKS